MASGFGPGFGCTEAITPVITKGLAVQLRLARPVSAVLAAAGLVLWGMEDNTVPLRDDGTGGDEVAGDGVYTATIPGQSAGTMVAFYVVAADAATPPASANYPLNAPATECLIRVDELQPTGNFPVYRIWMTQATLNTWTSRNRMNNTPFNVTFVLGNQRAIYNTEALYAGSPYIAPGYTGPTRGSCGYTISMPADDLFLGESALVLDWPGGHGREYTGLQEQMAYWIADRLNLPFSYRHHIRLQVNGVTDMQRNGVFEAVIQPAGEFVNEWSVDPQCATEAIRNSQDAPQHISRAFIGGGETICE